MFEGYTDLYHSNTHSLPLIFFVKLLQFGSFQNIPNHVMLGVIIIFSALGLENVKEIEEDVSDCDDDILFWQKSVYQTKYDCRHTTFMWESYHKHMFVNLSF